MKKEKEENKKDKQPRRRFKSKYIILLLIYIIIGFLIYSNWDSVKEKATGVALKNILNSPGGCKSQEECLNYCLEHQEECLNWCLDHPRFCDPVDKIEIPPEGGPGGCKTKGECLDYCTKVAHEKECKEFFNIK